MYEMFSPKSIGLVTNQPIPIIFLLYSVNVANHMMDNLILNKIALLG